MIRIQLYFFLLCSSLAGIAQSQKIQNAILISLDGCRWQEVFKGADSALLFSNKNNRQNTESLAKKYWAATPQERRKKLMPFLWGMMERQGRLYGNRELGNRVQVRNTYWFSYPGRSETMCGYYDPKINSNEYPDNPNENVFEFINQQKDYQGKVVAFAGWSPVAKIINRNRNGMLANIPGEDVKGENLTEAQKLANETQHYLPSYFGSSVRFDGNTFAIAKSYIAARHPKAIYLDFIDTDEFGHAGRYDLYLDAIRYLDAMIGSLWEMAQNDTFYKDKTMLMVYPDHGRGIGAQWKSHGSEIVHSNETWLAAMIPGVEPMGEMKTEGDIYQDQFAQTIARALGFIFKANHPVGEPILFSPLKK